MCLKFKIFIVFFILASTGLYSQDVKKITLEDAIKIGLENSKVLKISKSKIESAKAKENEIYNGMLPSLKFNGGFTRLSEIDPFEIPTPSGKVSFTPSFNQYQAKLTLAQPVFTGFRLESNHDMMEYQANASIEDLNKDKSQLVFDIKTSFWSYFKAMEFKKNVEENYSQLESHVHDLENMFKAGLATNNDVLKVKVQLSNIRLMQIDAENAIKLSMYALNNTLGLPILTEIDIDASVNFNDASFADFNSLLNTAIGERSELKAIELRVKMSEAGVKLAKAGWYPQINLSLNYYYNRPNQRIMPTRDEFVGTWDAGIVFSYDIWNWMTTSYQTEQAQANLEQSNFGAAQLKDGITLELSSSYINYKKSMEKINISKEAVEQAEENYRVNRVKLKYGVSINSDLLDAETALLIAKLQYTGAIVDYNIAVAKLERSIEKEN